MSIIGLRGIGVTVSFICLTSCAQISRHAFVEPTNAWHTRSGQLLYRGSNLTLIGDALVRYSRNGDFELTFSKAPGITLLAIREDAEFAEVKGALAPMSWSGPVNRAPTQFRGWFALRDQIISAHNQRTVYYSAGGEAFLLRF
jgi:hypothetical protein